MRKLFTWWIASFITLGFLNAEESTSFPGLLLETGTTQAEEKTVIVASRSADFRIEGIEGDYRVLFEVQLAETRNPIDFIPGAGAVQQLGRDADGISLTLRELSWDEERNRWLFVRGNRSDLFRYWPVERNTRYLNWLKEDGFEEPRHWHDRPVEVRLERIGEEAFLWVDGLFIRSVSNAFTAEEPNWKIRLGEGDQVLDFKRESLDADRRFVPVRVQALANDSGEKPSAVDGIPFFLIEGENNLINLRPAGWINQLRDVSSYYSPYDGGPSMLHDNRMPMIRVPKADYIAMHILAHAEESEETVPRFTIRAGIYNDGQAQVVQNDFVGEVPTGTELQHVRVPMSLAFAQDIGSGHIDMELTRDVRLAVRRPDPNRFQHRPLGLPSGVRIAAITMEKSPLQLKISSNETAHAFNQPDVPTFQVELTNITDQAQSFSIRALATGLGGEEVEGLQSGSVPAGATETVNVELPVDRGYHDVAFFVHDGGGELLLKRLTAMALLPEDTRQHRDTSRFGTWDFSGGHFTSNDPDEVGPLYVKMGIRFGMFGFKPDDLRKYGVWYGSEPNVHTGLEGMARRIDGREDRVLPYGQVFHETSISGPHSSRVPDFFHDRAPYVLNEREEERFATMWTQATDYVDQARAVYPDMHMRFGNGPIAVREEFYRRGLPADKFDSAGNEAGVFGRMPEAQPPDIVTFNATIWMDRQMLDHYGYEDKPVTLGYEIMYPNTNPGNLTYETQANYFVRHALHAWSWGPEHIRGGAISDMGNSYRFSNWGSSGFTRSRPELSVKPSFVSFATMTWVLDGAEFVRVVDTRSPSLLLFEFDRPSGGKVWAVWTVRGSRPVQLKISSEQEILGIDDQARETVLDVADGWVTVNPSPSPQYIVAGDAILDEVRLGNPDHSDQTSSDSIEFVGDFGEDWSQWSVVETPNSFLEFYNNKTAPRRHGKFSFDWVGDLDIGRGVVRVTPEPIKHGVATMPMYQELLHEEGIELPGEPTAIVVEVDGNSSWGRLIFELTDASGQTWISVGAAQTGDVSPWLQDWMPDDLIDSMKMAGLEDWNTNDIFGYSKINFDGWRNVSMPLPGNYPGEEGKRYHWYRSSQWHYDKDGHVHYPLTLKKVIVEIPEKTLVVDRFEPVPIPWISLGKIGVDLSPPHSYRDANKRLRLTQDESRP